MSRLFISHSSADNPAAFALAQWLTANNYGDYFLDTDSQRGLVPGERWMDQLRAAADKCEAVLCLISPNWLASEWCWDEFRLARFLHKRIFALIVADVPRDTLPREMKAEWQLCDLIGPDPIQDFAVGGATVSFRQEGLERLRRGLERAGLDPLGFPWTNDRPPYPGLRALEAEDAAIFFGRDSALIRAMDQVRGMAEAGTDRLLVILGASGAGKSSFLRAGLWPRLARDDTHLFPLPVIRPENDAMRGLAAALAGAYDRLGVRRAVGDIKAALSRGEAAFLAILDDLAARARSRLAHMAPDDPPPTLVLAVDQAEELLNPNGGAEAATFRALLSAALAPGRRMLAIATVRTDRYDRMQDQALFPGVGRALFDLFPMERTEFRAVIEGPAFSPSYSP